MRDLSKQTNGVDQHVGQSVRLYRKARGWSRFDLSRSLGIHPRTLRAYETGTERMGPKMLRNICLELGVEPGHVFAALDFDALPSESRHRSRYRHRTAS